MPRHSEKAVEGIRRLASVSFLIVCALTSCEKTQTTVAVQNPLAPRLAATLHDLAKSKSETAETLHLLLASLEADPAHQPSLHAIRELLAKTRWQYPAATLDLGHPISDFIVRENQLWAGVSTAENLHTVVRCNLDTLEIEAVLFPRKGEPAFALILSPDGKKIVIQRGNHASPEAEIPGTSSFSLLCDAQTLKPLLNLNQFPANLSAEALVVFSADSLLLGHPEVVSDQITWHIRDSATGQIIRSAPGGDSPPPLSASLDHQTLTIIRDDHTTLAIPLAPTSTPITSGPQSDLVVPAPAPPRSQPLKQPPAKMPVESRPPRRAGIALITPPAPPTPAVKEPLPVRPSPKPQSEGSLTFTLSQPGASNIRIHRDLPLPVPIGRDLSLHLHAAEIAVLAQIAEILTSRRLNENTRELEILTDSSKNATLQTLGSRNLQILGLDFAPVLRSISDNALRHSPPDAAFLLNDRLARAQAGSPRFLALHVNNPGAPEITVSPAAHFSSILQADHPAAITAALQSSENLPHVLRRLALSRVAWLENRKADAIALWAEGFPDLNKIRRSEDWDGWESIDFSSHLARLFTDIEQELATYESSADSSPEQKKLLAEKLLDPATSRVIGKERHAAACLASAATEEDFEMALQLVTLAKALGAPPAACLRVEAATLVKLGDFPKAHETYISLITDFPVETHQSRDYAETAYTAFENGDGDQAMEVLAAGIHRFPDDSDFAYRAGWISLLTGRSDRAYQFLVSGKQIGFPDEKLEKATALLAIAAAQTGAIAEADEHFHHLITIAPEWSDEDPPKASDWPDELRLTLRELAQPPPKAIPVEE